MADPKHTPTIFIKPIQCPSCLETAYIIRRAPDAIKRDGSEVWSFQCVNGHNTEKSGKR